MRRLFLLSCATALSACGEPPAPREAPRPVEVYALRAIDPASPLQLTGSVTAWKEQDVGFEVGGRVRFIEESGGSLEGRWEEGEDVRVEGQVLAELDDRPFRIAVATAEASVSVAREQIGVAAAQLEKVLPANLRAAHAEKELAQVEYERFVEAGETNAVSGLDVLRAKGSRDVAAAQVDQAEAAFAAQEADKRSREASLLQANEQLEDARWELSRCRLFAPFTAEVSEVFVEAGGFVRPGERVAHLVMMDPIQVDVAVSASKLRELRRYEQVQLSIPGEPDPLTARIYELGTIADPKTRTFRVSIIVRNRRRIGALAPGDPDRALPRVQNLFVLIRLDPLDSEGAWFVESRRSLHQDDQGWFVWASAEPEHAADLDPDRPVFTVRKVRVVPGERRVNYQGIYVLRELVDAGDLNADSLLPLDLPADFPEGERVLFTDSAWALRPGEIVSVLLAGSAPEPGLFLPMSVVQPEGDGFGHVFVVEDGQAHSVRLDVSDRVGPLVRVRAADAEDAQRIGPGAQVIRQTHFLHDGESVRVVRSHEVRP